MGKTIYTQKFRAKWKTHPKLRDWLEENEKDNRSAYCKLCKCYLKCKLCDLLMHADTKKHINRSADYHSKFDAEQKDMSEDEDGDDPEGSLSDSPSSKSKPQNNVSRSLRQPRQKFVTHWEQQFPWLKPDKTDPTLGICTICDKYLVCKKSHLERHEQSVKHQRTEYFEDINEDEEEDNVTCPNATEFMECGKADLEDTEMEGEGVVLDGVEESQIEQTSLPNSNVVKSKNNAAVNARLTSASNANDKTQQPPAKTRIVKLNRLKLLKLIERDRNVLNEFYDANVRQESAPSQPPQQQRDSFDLFFESVAASVKTLPPKLAAEVKSRVSQIMTEFELRAICEREAQENSVTTIETTTLVSPTHLTSSTEHATTVVPNIVYTFQPKLSE